MPISQGDKICKKCNISKPILSFSKNKRKKDGLEIYCKKYCSNFRKARKKICAVPSCLEKIEPESTRCIKHANIKKAYPNVSDSNLENISFKKDSKKYFSIKVKEYRADGKTKKKCNAIGCNKLCESRSTFYNSHATVKQHHPELSLKELEKYTIVKKSRYKLVKWAKAVKSRGSYICQICGSGNKLHAHHILSQLKHPNLKYDIANGQTLCQSCHIEVHRSEGLR